MRTVNFVVPSHDELTLIKQYLELTKPLHNMTTSEIRLMAVVIKNIRAENGNLHKVLYFDGRVNLCEELGISENALNVQLTRLRKKNIIKKDTLQGIVTQCLNYDESGLKLTINFQING